MDKIMQSTSYAKWILTGEHAVVRGHRAIAFPMREFSCTISFQKNSTLTVDNPDDYQIAIDLLNASADYLHIPVEKLYGNYSMTSQIPPKSGLGSSAAICVNIAKIIQQMGLSNSVLELAKHMENYFHTKSSGLDIAVTLKNRPIVFQNNQFVDNLECKFWPHMILTHSGLSSSTATCANKVKSLIQQDSVLSEELDLLMNESSLLCETALKDANIQNLRDGINLACDVFDRWGLCNEQMKNQMLDLRKKGAIATKPVGSGLGGYILSLWEENPQKYVDICLTLPKP